MNAAPASIPPMMPRSAAMLRRIRLLPRRRLPRRRLLLCGRRRFLTRGRGLLRGGLALVVEHDRGLDLRGDLGQVGKGLLGIHRGLKHKASLATPTERGRGGSAAVAVNEILQPREDSQTGSGAEVLRRPRPSPRSDDRLLRASLLRPADLSLPCPARP